MPDIFHNFSVNGPANKVFEGISTSRGLDNWWTKKSEGKPSPGETYTLYFGPEFNWKAIITKCTTNKEFELEMTDAYPDWIGTRIGFILHEKSKITEVGFYHTGWPRDTDNYRVSSYCWAMYLRILKRLIEFGEKVPYEQRLEV